MRRRFRPRQLNSAHGRQRLFLLWLALGLFFSAAPVSAETVPPDDYWALVAETRAQVIDLRAGPPEAHRAALDELALRWEAITAVVLPDGTVMPLDHAFLLSYLRADPPNLEAIDDLLGALEAALADWPEPRHTAADLDRLQTILNRPEFDWPDAEPSFLSRLWTRLVEAINRLLSRLLTFNGAEVVLNGPLGYLLTFFSVLVVAAILAYAARGLLGGVVREAVLSAASGADEVVTLEGAQQEAQRLSALGDYRSAVRYLYLAALLSLEARGLMRYDRSLTNREYLRRMVEHPETATVLREVVEVFDRVWYGYEPLDAAGYGRYAARVAELRRPG